MIERETSKGKTPILIAEQKNVIGLILVSDTPKTNADRAIKEIKKLGIDIIMMTGDAKNTAKHIANILDIDEYFAEVSPEDKLKKIQELQSK
jgi:Cu+-exporting ATPase